VANKEILLVVDVFSNEKDIEKEIVFQAIESALEAATIKRHANQIKARVSINRKTGDYVTYRVWELPSRLLFIKSGKLSARKLLTPTRVVWAS
jgi:N utilization substance protein A